MSKKTEEDAPDNLLRCPECGSLKVIVREVRSVDANTFEHWCHSVKAYDGDAEAWCRECEWTGQRQTLAGY